jgi:hypothetical protein
MDITYLYIAGATAVVLIVLMISQLYMSKSYKYTADYKLAVKTSNGLIKMNNRILADELSKVSADLQKFKGRNQSVTYAIPIAEAIQNIKHFIKKNPGVDLCRAEIRANEIHQALQDNITTDEVQRNLVYKTILDSDSEYIVNDRGLLEYMIKHIDLLIQLLHNDVCVDGVVDLGKLQDILEYMDKDLNEYNSLERSYGNELGSKYDPYDKAPRRIFIKDASQLEGFVSLENDNTRKFAKNNHSMTSDNHRLQTRSEEFRTNKTSWTKTSDEELLKLSS